jgi:hypothetical protein
MIGYDRNKTMACEVCGVQQYRVNDPKTVVSHAGLIKGVRCNKCEDIIVSAIARVIAKERPFRPTFDSKGRLTGGMR